MSGELILPLLVSACLGALIGLERQWEGQMACQDQEALTGVRTFTLLALFGALCAYVGQTQAIGFFTVGFVAVAALLAVHHFLLMRRAVETPGLTTLVTSLLTFLIGGLVFWKQTRVGLILTVSVILLLAGKRTIHRWTEHFTTQDVRLALQFAAVTGVILPLAPNRAYGPFQAFNPFMIWLMVVLVAGLGFFGYVAMRLLGSRGGLGAMGLLGGLASSTATTLACSRQSRERTEWSEGFAFAIILACTVMLARVGILAFTVGREIFWDLGPRLAIMALPGTVYAAWYFLRREDGSRQQELPSVPNPLSLKIALQFAVIYAVIVFLTRAAGTHYGNAGVHVVSFISGLTDMDAIVLSLSQMAGSSSLSASNAARAMMLAATSNTLLKVGFVMAVAAPGVRRRILVVLGPTLLMGLALWWF